MACGSNQIRQRELKSRIGAPGRIRTGPNSADRNYRRHFNYSTYYGTVTTIFTGLGFVALTELPVAVTVT